jgi:hypothetical protein
MSEPTILKEGVISIAPNGDLMVTEFSIDFNGYNGDGVEWLRRLAIRRTKQALEQANDLRLGVAVPADTPHDAPAIAVMLDTVAQAQAMERASRYLIASERAAQLAMALGRIAFDEELAGRDKTMREIAAEALAAPPPFVKEKV